MNSFVTRPSRKLVGYVLLATLVACETPDQVDHDLAPVRLEPVAEFGCVDCTGPELFGAVVSISASPDGMVAVVTPESPHLRLLGPGPGVARELAPTGDGPGEVRTPITVAVLADGSTLLAGQATDRFDAVGAHVRRTSSMDSSLYRTLQLVTSPSATHLLSVQKSTLPGGSGRLVLLDGVGREVESVMTVPEEVWLTDDSPRLVILVAHAVSDDGRVAIGIGGQEEYKILVVDDSAHVVARARRDIPRPLRSSREVEDLERRISAVTGRASPGIPLERPHFAPHAFRFDAGGRLWVFTFRGTEGTTVFDVFGHDLDYLGEVIVDQRVEAFHISGDFLAASTLGESDLPGVTVWRIEGQRE